MYVCVALIETVKAPVENIDVLEELIRAGAIVSYKTLKHGKSAMDWARQTLTYIHTYILTHTYIYTYSHIHTYLHSYNHKSSHTYIHAYTNTDSYLHTYIHMIHILTHTYTHILTCTYMHIHLHTHIHKYTHTHTCTFIYIDTYMHAYITYTYILTYIHTLTYFQANAATCLCANSGLVNNRTATNKGYIHTYIHTYIHAMLQCVHLLFKNHIYVIHTYIHYCTNKIIPYICGMLFG